jgi:hypothetical protein
MVAHAAEARHCMVVGQHKVTDFRSDHRLGARRKEEERDVHRRVMSVSALGLAAPVRLQDLERRSAQVHG